MKLYILGWDPIVQPLTLANRLKWFYPSKYVGVAHRIQLAKRPIPKGYRRSLKYKGDARWIRRLNKEENSK